MQKDTERGLISVEAEYVSAFKAKADGFSFAFHSKKLGGDVWDKTLDDEGKRHSFCFRVESVSYTHLRSPRDS